VQLEAGAVATPFEFEDYGTTLQKCQRYYYRHASNTVGVAIGIGAMITSTTLYVMVNFPTAMRTAPLLESSTGTNYYNFYRANAFDYTNSLTIANAGINTAYLYNNTEVSGTQGDAGVMFVDNASGYIAFSSEL